MRSNAKQKNTQPDRSAIQDDNCSFESMQLRAKVLESLLATMIKENLYEDLPGKFQCVLTTEVMLIPATAADDQNYEYTAIAAYLAHQKNNNRIPRGRTGVNIPNDTLKPNGKLQEAIIQACRKRIIAARPINSDDIENLSLAEKMQYLHYTIHENLTRFNKPPYPAIFLNFSNFLFSECQLFMSSQQHDAHFTCYYNLLFAMAVESFDFNKRSGPDNLLVLIEIFTRITLISSCPFEDVFLKKWQSRDKWADLVRQSNHFDRLFLIGLTQSFKRISEYAKHYPVAQQLQLSSPKIIALRTAEADQRRLEAEVVAEAEAQERERMEADQRRLAAEAQQRIHLEMEQRPTVAEAQEGEASTRRIEVGSSLWAAPQISPRAQEEQRVAQVQREEIPSRPASANRYESGFWEPIIVTTLAIGAMGAFYLMKGGSSNN